MTPRTACKMIVSGIISPVYVCRLPDAIQQRVYIIRLSAHLIGYAYVTAVAATCYFGAM